MMQKMRLISSISRSSNNLSKEVEESEKGEGEGPCTSYSHREIEKKHGEAHTSAVFIMKEQPSSPAVEAANTFGKDTLTCTQEPPKLYQGMHEFSFPVGSIHAMRDCIPWQAIFLE